jgi:anti-anti-sigma factor
MFDTRWRMLDQSERSPSPSTRLLPGEIDMAVAPELEPRLLDLAVRTAEPSVAFDCSGLTFIDSSGVKMLENVVSGSGKSVQLLNLDPGCRLVFEVLDLCQTFGI